MRKYTGEFKLSQYTSLGIWNEKLKKPFCKGHLPGLCKNYFLYPVRLIFQVRCINCFVFILPQAGDTLLKLSLRHLANVNQPSAETSQIRDWILNRKTDQVMIAARTRPQVQVSQWTVKVERSTCIVRACVKHLTMYEPNVTRVLISAYTGFVHICTPRGKGLHIFISSISLWLCCHQNGHFGTLSPWQLCLLIVTMSVPRNTWSW